MLTQSERETRAFMTKARATITKYAMLEKNDGLVVGLSGGADSMALLFALLLLRADYALTLSAAHINHGLRPGEAERDEAFVRAACQKLDIPLKVERFDIAAVARETGMTQEEAGRAKRYAVFETARMEFAADKIAVAHNRNDQAETVLMRLIRGTGTAGLSGIPPVRGNIIRPLIAHTRDEIERFMAANRYAYVTDGSNRDEVYTRNKIRRRLIPYIEKEWNPKLVAGLARAGQIAAEDSAYIEAAAEAAYKQCAVPDGLLATALLGLHPAIQKRVLRKACFTAANRLKDITYDHLNEIAALAAKGTGKTLLLPHGLRVENRYGTLVFSITPKAEAAPFCYGLPKADTPEPLFIKETGQYAVVCYGENNRAQGESPPEKMSENFNKLCTKQFDCDRIMGTLSLRNSRRGDRIPLCGGGTKKIAKELIDLKIPAQDRWRTLLLTDDDGVLWIVGGRVSKKHEADASAKRTVIVTVWGGYHERNSNCRRTD